MIPDSAVPILEPSLVVLYFKCPRTIKIDAKARINATDGHQPEWFWLRWLAAFQGVGQRSVNKRCGPAHLIDKAVEMGN